MRNFKLNPESPLINLFKGNEDLLDYPVIVSVLAELSNEPLSFEGLHRLFFTRDDISSDSLFDQIIQNKTYEAADELLPYIGEMLENHRDNQSNNSKFGLTTICGIWEDNGVLDEAYEYSVEQSPDFTLLDALEREFKQDNSIDYDEESDYYKYSDSPFERYASLIRAPINKGIALEVLNNGAVYQATVDRQDQSKEDAHTR